MKFTYKTLQQSFFFIGLCFLQVSCAAQTKVVVNRTDTLITKYDNDSRIIDLEGGKRIIKDITLWYDTKNRAKRRATVHLYGRH